MRTYALDTEAYYDSECSITTLGVWAYLRHPKSDHYLLSVVGDDGFKWVGHPKDFDWSKVSGPDVRWCFHNAAYDLAVFKRLEEIGHKPVDATPGDWVCTADLAAYNGVPRNLKGAVEYTFKGSIQVSKDTRNAMKGQRWDDMTPEFQKEVMDYALQDSACCLALWEHYGNDWPENEKRISQHTAQMGWYGLPVNLGKMDEGLAVLKDHIWEAEGQIPWADSHPTLSPKQLAEYCRRAGIEPPRSLAQDSDECAAWEDKFGEEYPWVGAMRTYRRCNALMKKLETMRTRTRPDGRMNFGMKYCGAHTGRDSGDAGFNVQNLPRKEMFGVDLRRMIEAPPGKTFVACDLNAIEPRTLHYLAGDTVMMDKLREGYTIYEAFALSTGMWTGEPGTFKSAGGLLYQVAKSTAIGCGYGMGAPKFFDTAPLLTGGAYTPTLQEAQTAVATYRARNPKILALWRKLDSKAKFSVGKDFSIELPSGRVMTYRDVQLHGGLSAVLFQGGRDTRTKLFGGKFAEQITQATSRDVFMDTVVRLLDADLNVILRVHDEAVVECDEEDAERVKALMLDIMTTPPSWAPDLPLGAEAEITKVYKK